MHKGGAVMQPKRAMISAFMFSIIVFLSMGTVSWGEEITFAGVTHLVNEEGAWINLGLGVDVYPDAINSAYVTGPGGFRHDYSPEQFQDDGFDIYYWYSLPGTPEEGDYTFTVQFSNGDSSTATDTQGSVVTLPIVESWQIAVDGNHTTTPTFSWDDLSQGNYYRVQVFDENWNVLYRTARSTNTSVTIPPGTLPTGIEYQMRVEIHDSDSYETLNNRSNGELLYLDTILIPFAGVTNVNRPDGIKTHLDLGINVPEGDVASAYVAGPDGFHYDFQPSDFQPQFSEYFVALDGSPTPGEYTFTLVLNDGSSQSVYDTQGSLETLPVIRSSEYEVIGDDGITPTFKWPEVPGMILFYRASIFDTNGTRVVSSGRLGGTAFVTMPWDLLPNTTYYFRAEVHDSNLFDTLNNRSNGEMLEFTTGDLPGPPTGTLKVIPVPWVGTAPLIPHDAYNGKEITFKAIARGGDGTYFLEWDFDGDGVYDYSGTTTNRYDLSARYTYPDQSFDRIFSARIRVSSGGEIVTANYPVRVHSTATRSVKVNVAIDEALWWIHQNLLRWESGDVQFGTLTDQMLGSTGAAVQAWENQGHKPSGDYDTNPYVEDVRRGMNFILSKSNPYPIHIEDTRDPDTLVNGYGIHSIFQSQLYETGIVLMALASSSDPALTCEVGGFGMYGRSYGEIAQDMVDFLAFAQNEPDVGVWRGGWRYGPNYDQSDMSVTQWPVIGMEAAESNFGTVVPHYVKDELQIYLTEDQDSDGGFGYTAPGGNVARTGAGIACLAWIGAAPSDNTVTNATGFIDNNWDWDNQGNLYAMYAVMKGMRGFEPNLTMIGTHDWYAEYTDFLIENQSDDGSWTSEQWYGREMATPSGVLILTPEVFVSPPVAVAKASPIEASPCAVITFDHSQSYHRDPERRLVMFRWDFDEDGEWNEELSDITANPTFEYCDDIICGQEVEHRAVLEVEDDLGNTDVDDETVVIRINLENHPPVADGDPTDSYPNYYVTPGETVLLDARESYDPDETQGDYITLWEWDLDNDGTFEASGETLEFTVPGDWQPGSLYTATLQVTDDGSWASGCGGELNLVDQTTVTLAVGAGLDCANAEPSVSKLWPPNHRMESINIIGLTNSNGEPANVTIASITQDEPVNGLGDGDIAPDASGIGTSTAEIRAERSGTGNGRVYEIRFFAQDDTGAFCEGAVNVYVAHDKKDLAIDDGQAYDSTLVQ
jgi:hypothetical protein